MYAHNLGHIGTTVGNYMRLPSVAVQREEPQWHVRSLECDWADVTGEHSAYIHDIHLLRSQMAYRRPCICCHASGTCFLLSCRCNLTATERCTETLTPLFGMTGKVVSAAVFPACTYDDVFVCKCNALWIRAVYRTSHFAVCTRARETADNCIPSTPGIGPPCSGCCHAFHHAFDRSASRDRARLHLTPSE